MGSKEGVKNAKKQTMERFECDDVGEMKEYIGCKVERNREDNSMKLTQPVLLQSFEDEFDLPDGAVPKTPAVPGEVLVKSDATIDERTYKRYRSGVGKLLHLMKRSRPEVSNAVRGLSKFMTSDAGEKQMNAMYRVMKYCVGTPNRGMYLKPTRIFDGTPEFENVIEGNSDACYATDTDTRISVGGHSTTVNGVTTAKKSARQRTVSLSITEAELISAVECAQEMVFQMNILESVNLRVQIPMILWVDNKGTIDLVNKWSVGGQTRHVESKTWYLRAKRERHTQSEVDCW